MVAAFHSDGQTFLLWVAGALGVVGALTLVSTMRSWPTAFFLGGAGILLFGWELGRRSSSFPHYAFWLSDQRIWWRVGTDEESVRLENIVRAHLARPPDTDDQLILYLRNGRELRFAAGAMDREKALLESIGYRFE